MKPWYTSKTVWFNIVTFVIGLFAIPSVVQLVPSVALPILAIVNPVGNYVLRFLTTTAIAPFTPPVPPAV